MDLRIASRFLFALPVLVVAAEVAAGDEPEVVRLGSVIEAEAVEREEARAGFGPFRTFEFAAEAYGPVTVTLVSYDFDAFLVVRDEQGDLVAEDDDGLMHRHSRVVIPGRPGAHFEITAGTDDTDSAGGRFLLRVLAGDVPPPSGNAALKISARTYAGWGRQTLGKVEGIEAPDPKIISTAAQWLLGAADTHWKAGEYGECGVAARETAELARRIDNPGQEIMARSFEAAAMAATGSPDRGLDELARLLEVAKGSNIEAFVLQRAGDAALVGGRFEASRRYYEQLAEVGEAAGQFEVIVSGLIGVTRAAERSGDVSAARTAFLRIAEGSRERGMAAQVYEATRQLALLENRFGLYRSALVRFESLRDDATNPADRLAASGHVADIHWRLGFLATSRSGYLAMLAEARELGDHANERAALYGLAILSHELGDNNESEALLTTLIDDRPIGPSLALDLSALHMTRAVVREEIDGLDAAKPDVERAIEFAEATGDDAHLARMLINVGHILQQNERWDEAAMHEGQALEIVRRAGLSALEARLLSNRAYWALHQGDPQRAESLAAESLHILDGLELGETVAASDAMENLASARLVLGRADEVASLIDRAMAIIDRPDTRALGIQEASRFRSRLAGWAAVSQDLTALEVAAADESELAAIVRSGWARSALWKGRAVLEGIQGGDRRAPAPTRDQTRDALEAALMGLGPDELLIDYVAGRSDLYAYVATEGDVQMLRLGQIADIEQRVEEFAGLLRRPPDGDDVEVLDQGAALGKVLLPAIARKSDSGGFAQRLLVIPHSSLAKIPFEALVLTRGDGLRDSRFVLDEVQVAYGPSMPVIAALAAREPIKGGRTLAMADPRYSDVGLPASGPEPRGTIARGPAFPRLPGTRLEALTLAALALDSGEEAETATIDLRRLEVERDGVLSTETVEVRLGSAATRASLLGDSGEFGLIHIAAHGVVDSSDPRRSGVALSGGDEGFLSLAEVLECELDANLTVLSACETARGKIRRGEGVQSLASAFLHAGSRSVVASLWRVDDEVTAMTMQRFYQLMLAEGYPAERALYLAKTMIRESGSALPRTSAMGRERGAPVGKAVGRVPRAETAHPYFWAPFIYIGP